MKNYGFKNNFLLYIIPSAIVPFYVILIKTYMEQLPECMEESAKVDGASYFLIFIRIIMPLSLPVLATVAIYSAVTQWNTWQDNFYLVHSRSLKTLQLLLLDYLQTMNQNIINNVSEASQRAWQVSTTTIQMSISVISMIPILLVYPFLQRYFVKGIMLGAVKG
jgi:ABC-type sugar transport system, permease component